MNPSFYRSCLLVAGRTGLAATAAAQDLLITNARILDGAAGQREMARAHASGFAIQRAHLDVLDGAGVDAGLELDGVGVKQNAHRR